MSKTLAPDGFVIKGSFGNWYCVRGQQRMALELEYITQAAANIAFHSMRHCCDELQSLSHEMDEKHLNLKILLQSCI